MMNLGLMDPAFLGGLGLQDPDAAAYISAVEAADGQALEIGVRDAINAFVLGCKTDGIWNAIKASCILAGARTLAGALVPLVGAAPTRHGTEGGWNYNRKTGLRGNGTDNFINTNRNVSATTSVNSIHLAAALSLLDNTLRAVIGYFDNTAGAYFYANSADFFARVNSQDVSEGRFTAVSGFTGISRSSSSEWVGRAGQLSTTRTSASTYSPNGNAHVFGLNRPSGNPLIGAHRIYFYSLGEALDLALLDARVTALVNALAVAIP
jgi:hypothetical protein